MAQVVIVRSEKCEGCLYSRNALDRDANESRKLIKEDKDLLFSCHCFSGEENTGFAMCRGFYDAHPERLPNVRMTSKKGELWQRFLKAKKGAMLLNKASLRMFSKSFRPPKVEVH